MIHCLHDLTGKKLTNNDYIADRFVEYYTQLYNLKTNTPQTEIDARRQLLRDFLSQHCPTPVSEVEATDLEQPLSLTELEAVLKQLKPGISPGPDGLTVGYYKTFIDTLKTH